MRINKVTAVLALSLMVIAAVLVYKNLQNSTSDSSSSEVPRQQTDAEQEEAQAISEQADLTIGQESAPITILEFADFKCPVCNRFEEGALKDIKREYIDTGKAKLVFRTLAFIGEDSQPAAEGAYCANEQGKFVEYHDRLFAHIRDKYYKNGNIGEGESAKVFTAEMMGGVLSGTTLNIDKIVLCIQAGTYKKAIDIDKQTAEFAGVSGTPTVKINGQQIVGAQPFTVYKKLLELPAQ